MNIFLKTLFLFAISLNSITAQKNIKSGKAEYSITTIHDARIDGMPERYKAQMLKMEEDANSLIFCLNFTANESSFLICNDVDVDNSILYLKTKKPIYLDVLNKKIQYNNSNAVMGSIKENSYIIENKTELVWQLFNETKLIDKFTCFKATTTYIYESKIPQTITVTAWYCPTIPFHTGPNGFYGLPGLIMEINDRNATIGLKKLILLEEEIKIQKPKEATIISNQDYNKLVQEKIQQ